MSDAINLLIPAGILLYGLLAMLWERRELRGLSRVAEGVLRADVEHVLNAAYRARQNVLVNAEQMAQARQRQLQPYLGGQRALREAAATQAAQTGDTYGALGQSATAGLGLGPFGDPGGIAGINPWG